IASGFVGAAADARLRRGTVCGRPSTQRLWDRSGLSDRGHDPGGDGSGRRPLLVGFGGNGALEANPPAATARGKSPRRQDDHGPVLGTLTSPFALRRANRAAELAGALSNPGDDPWRQAARCRVPRMSHVLT